MHEIKDVLVKHNSVVFEHLHVLLCALNSHRMMIECNPVDLHGNTNQSLTELLLNSGYYNPYVRDVTFSEEGLSCNAGNTEFEIEIKVDEAC